ncbi:hypothetical protein N0V83_005437 [Neocucurbitaria cava]|uniref:Uncharacterized protein n=1 Tax=Neocucurbitaria cava TaxID=798079 RepID=A0A9W8Y725_9PLEO|nr:hypothetical protein N0V83_005437 [Neocucurbitaria cava]
MDTCEDKTYREQQLQAVKDYEEKLKDEPLSQHCLIHRVSTKEGTEYCYEGCSRLHRLACGHVIYTEMASMCGKNCSAPVSNYAPFMCAVCEHWKTVQSKQVPRRSSHFTELILPDFPALDQSQVPFFVRARACTAVYLLPKSHVLVLQSMKDIAVARLDDKIHLDHILDEITEITKGCSASFIDSITQGIASCIENQHLWIATTYEELAVANVYVAGVWDDAAQPGMLTQLAKRLKVDVVKVHGLIDAVTKTLADLKARAAIASFMPMFAKMFPAKDLKHKQFASLVLSLWYRVQKCGLLSCQLILQHWLRIVAACIHAAILANDLVMPIHKICAAVGVSQYGHIGDNFDLDVLLLVEDGEFAPIWGRTIESRRNRKLKARKAQAKQMQVGSSVSFKVDTSIVTAEMEEETTQLLKGFGVDSSFDDVEDGSLKRRRVA